MRTPVVAGNWKMNGNRTSVQALMAALKTGVDSQWKSRVLVCPPYPYLELVAESALNTPIKVGAQNLSEHPAGAHTGEVAAEMLVDLGCSYVIVGHSERRSLQGETDAQVAAKVARALEAGLTPILCVGESLEQRQQAQTLAVVGAQLTAVLDVVGVAAFEKIILAYEPVWAIGTGLTATPEQAQEVHQALRSVVAAQDGTVAAALPILYGGSVKAANAASLFACPDIDGGLIGGASLDANEFLAICQAAE